MKTEAQQLAHMVGRTREYTLSYLRHLKDVDPHREFVCEGQKLNTLFWLVAHMATTENGLLLYSTGGPFQKFSWAKHYNIGGAGLPKDQAPPYEEVWAMFKAVHVKAMDHVPTLDDEALAEPNITNLPALGNTVHDVITHAIRHEGLHAGHVSWLCKLYGIKTM